MFSREVGVATDKQKAKYIVAKFVRVDAVVSVLMQLRIVDLSSEQTLIVVGGGFLTYGIESCITTGANQPGNGGVGMTTLGPC